MHREGRRRRRTRGGEGKKQVDGAKGRRVVETGLELARQQAAVYYCKGRPRQREQS
jgi:hypothetical protein